MDSTSFYVQLQRLSDYFGKKLTTDQGAMYYNHLDLWFTDETFVNAVDRVIRDTRPTQSGFPTVRDLQSHGVKPPRQWRVDETQVQYFDRVGIDMLWIALGILERNGREAMISYCRANHISDEDIDRIEQKHSVTYRKTNGDTSRFDLHDMVATKV